MFRQRTNRIIYLHSGLTLTAPLTTAAHRLTPFAVYFRPRASPHRAFFAPRYAPSCTSVARRGCPFAPRSFVPTLASGRCTRSSDDHVRYQGRRLSVRDYRSLNPPCAALRNQRLLSPHVRARRCARRIFKISLKKKNLFD